MNWVYRLQRKLGRGFGISNLMMYVAATMLAAFILGTIYPQLYKWIFLSRSAVLRGEVWRLATFLFIPFDVSSPIWTVITLYFMYLLGGNLESVWGTGNFTLYYIFGVVGAVIAGLIAGTGTNYYIYLSVFLAYAYMFPDATFLLFFIIPVKAKYLAFLEWALYALAFIAGTIVDRVAILFSLLNFFLFFGPQVWNQLTSFGRRLNRRRKYQNGWKDGWR